MTGKSKVILTATELIVEQLREIGIDITVQIATGGGQSTAEKLAGKQAMQTGGGGLSIRESEGIVDLFYDVNITRNPFNWADSRFTELLEAQTSELDPEKRRQMYTEMEGILQQGTAHNFPVFWYTRSAAVDYRIVNYQRHFNYHTVLKRDHIWFDPDMKVEDAIRLRPDVNR
jgi:ABC-type transport system substrate-binding protein